MTIPLRQSTASQEIPLGTFVDDTDGKTAETGLTIANTDIKIWMHGATTLANKNSGGATHISGGNYYAVLDDTDTATAGGLVIFCQMAGALPVKQECMVYPTQVFDSMFSTDLLQVDVTQIGGGAQSATDLKDFADTGYDPATHKVQGVVTTDAIAAAGIDSIWDENMEGTTTAREQMNINHAVLAGKSDGGGTATGHYRDVADSKNRVTVTMDADGNRTAITTDGA